MSNTENKLWNQFKIILNSLDPGKEITRQEFITILAAEGLLTPYSHNKNSYGTKTLDSYRNYLTQAGFLKTVKRGIYQRTELVLEEDTTIGEVLKLAYPKG